MQNIKVVSLIIIAINLIIMVSTKINLIFFLALACILLSSYNIFIGYRNGK
ncbi:hypothetical protein SAMN02745191_1153 [Anaerorhabdus furcosa]|uniref:Uncharacterized protein n=1 Tax=Anaerorhabdus furcosa TaxID=118967 RepID=A0A1T4M2A7_9FIRM|nr:hypothetical protein SAMN02745191_1153 [Anaerorhabdus furcosa]